MTRKQPDPDVVDKERQVVELRRSGATYEDIARALGYSNASGAWHAFRRAMQRTLVDAGTEELRALEVDRLDRMQRAVWGRVVQGDLAAITTVLRLMDRRARLLGLDAPVKHDLTVETVDGSSIDAEVARLVAMLNQSAQSASS